MQHLVNALTLMLGDKDEEIQIQRAIARDLGLKIRELEEKR